MNTTAIKIKNLKHFNEINALLNINDLEVFATFINNLIEQVEQQKDAINDYENERQYLMDKIAEMQGTRNIYVFDKEDEYNDIQIQQEQEPAEIINLFKQEEKKEQEQEQQETYIYGNMCGNDYDIKQDEIYKKRLNDKSPLNLFDTLKDYIDNFSRYNKEHKKAVKKAIVEDFKKAGFKVKANNGYYYGLNIILNVNKKDLLDNQDLDYLSEKASNNYNYYEFQYYWDNFNKEISLYAPENIEILRNMINKRNSIVYNRFSLSRYEEDKKSAVELFYKKEVIEHILKTAKNILFKYSILKSYDAYSDYNSTYLTFDFDFIINLKD